jgi:hypothetical protein
VVKPGGQDHPLRRRVHYDFPGAANKLHWSLKDPSKAECSEEERLPVFREVRDGIRRRIE